MTWLETAINVSASSALLFIGIGSIKQLKIMENMDKCAKFNYNLGFSATIVSSGLILSKEISGR